MPSPARVNGVKIDSRSPEHPYQQFARQLWEQIESGKITSALSSITDLTAERVWPSAARAAPSASS
jgi:hypothetical protein